MRRFKKRIAVGVVLLLTVGLGAYFGADTARQRAILVAAIELWTGGTFQIEGDVSFSIGRISSVSAERLTFALPSVGSSGTVNRIRVSIDSLSAISGPLFVEEVIIEQGQIRVVGPPRSEAAAQETPSESVRLPIVRRIEITDTRLEFPANAPGDYITMSIDQIAVREVGDTRELEVAGEGSFGKIPLALTGSVGPFEGSLDSVVNAPLRLAVSSSGGRTTAVGTISDMFGDAQLDVAVTANAVSGSVLDRVTEPLGLRRIQFDFTGKLLGPIARPQVADLEVRIESEDASLALTGKIGDAATGAGMDVRFKGSFGGDYLHRSIADLPQSLDLEKIDASGRVKGALSRIDLSELDVSAQLASQTRLSATGQLTLADALSELNVTDADLALRLAAPTAQLLSDLIDDHLSTLGAVEGEAHFTGSDGMLALERIDLFAGKGERLNLRMTGRIPWTGDDLVAGIEAMEVRGKLTAEDTSDLTPLLGVDMPSIGAIELRTAVRPRGGDLDLTDVTIEISGPGDLQIAATGGARVRDVLSNSFLTDIDAAIQITSPTSNAFLRPLTIELAELGGAKGTAQITGDEDKLSVQSIDIRFGETEELKVGVTGQIKEIDLLADGEISDLVLDVTAEAPSVTAIEQRFDIYLPELGPVRATARLRDDQQADTIVAETFLVSVGPDTGPVLSITGGFDNILAPQKGVMKATVQADSVQLAKAMGWPSIVGLETVTSDMELTAQDGSLGIERLTMASVDSDAISITARGAIDDLLNFDQVDLDIVLSAPDAKIFDPALQSVMRPTGALRIEGKIVVAKPDIRFVGGLRLGDNNIDATLTGSIAGARPSLVGQVTAKRLELGAFGIDALSREADQPAQVARSNEQHDYIFDKEPLPFEALFAADLDLTVTADGGHGLGQSFNALQAQVRLQDGRLSLDPFKIAYDGGNVEFSSMVDASVDPPTVKLRLRGSDFELSELLLYVQAEPTAAGDLTGNFELESRGVTPRELAENLSGTADLALESGRVNGINLHVLSNETLEYLFSLPNLSQTTELRCAIARFDIETGVAKSQALLFATPRMTLSGAGWVDFGNEKLDITLSADPKSFVPVIFKKPVRILGEFSDLDYSTSSATTGLLRGVFGKVAGFVAVPFVFAPVSAAGSLVEILAETGEESPCLAAGIPSSR